MDSFQTYVTDILQVAARIKHQSGGVAPLIMGCGTSALAVMDLEVQFPDYCSGTIHLGATLKLKRPFPAWRRFLVAQLMYAKPHARLPRYLKPRLVDAKVKPSSKASETNTSRDSRNRMQVSAALIHEVLRAIEWSGTRVMRLSKPSLFIFAKQDRIIDPEAALKILLRHKKPELFEIETVESRWHNPCRDPEAESKVTRTIFNWYKKVFTVD